MVIRMKNVMPFRKGSVFFARQKALQNVNKTVRVVPIAVLKIELLTAVIKRLFVKIDL